jgi:serine/threonine protein kinase
MHEQFKVGQYALVRKLGEGGMAEVWEARHVQLGTRAAIKFLLPRLAGDPELEERFFNEGRRQARLQHPNVISAIDFLQSEGRSYLITQYVEGDSLETKLKEENGPLTLDDIRNISTDVLNALGYAHSMGVVHRDVKPSNILLNKDGRALLGDFGIALALGEDRRLTRTGVAAGTPEYMSPEQIVRPKAVDARSDIYSFGCVLYAMLTGRPPFGMEGATEFYIKDCHVRTSPPPLVCPNPDISPGVKKVVLQCLEKDPDKRFQTCHALLTALASLPKETAHVTKQEIGQYVLERRLGEGGMAEVWAARHKVLGTRVAIKFLTARLAGIPDIEQRFLGEGKRQAQLQHPNIVAVHDFLNVEGRSYIVMKYVEGQNLDERLCRLQSPMTVPEALAISTEVLHALGYAHSRNVIHRDVKPSNILVEGSGSAYVMDFGIALALDEARATQVGMAIGTPHFMSPEQIVGTRNIDCRSDIYSFGCVLYQMLTLVLPFEIKNSDGDSDYLIKDKHLRSKPASLRKLNPNVPEHIDRVVLRCLEKNPSDRFASCEQLLLALNESPSTRPPTTIETPFTPVTNSHLSAKTPLTPRTVLLTPMEQIRPVSAPVSASGQQSQPGPRRTWLWALIGVMVTVILLGGGFFVYSHRQKEVRSESIAVPLPPSIAQTESAPSNSPPDQTAVVTKPEDEVQAPTNPPDAEPVVKPPKIPTPKRAVKPQSVSKSAPPPIATLSGNWRGTYTDNDVGQVKKVSIRIFDDGAGALTGSLLFDSGGSDASNCPLTGNYKAETKFMVLIIGTCRGNPPDYLQGTFGFASVNLDDRQALGVEQKHNSLLSLNR